MHTTLPDRPVRKRPVKLSTAVTLMVSAVIVTVLFSVHLFYFVQTDELTRSRVQDKAMAVARTLAGLPQIQQALSQPPGAVPIQSLALHAQQSNDLLFVVITDMQQTRYTHPRPDAIGQHFIGDDILPALQGQENVSVNHGVLDEALRVFTPVYNAQHQQIGVVAIGIALTHVTAQLNHNRWKILWTVLAGALVGAIGTFILVRRLKGILFGLEPHEISALFEQRQAMLHSVKEGIIAVDDRAQVTLINQAARRLLREGDAHQPFSTDQMENESLLLQHLREVLHSGNARRDEEINVRGRILLSNTLPVRLKGGTVIGAICTFRDKTEVSQLLQRLDGLVSYVDALRERSHEFMNKLHVILGLLHLKNYSQLESYILKTANGYQTEIGSLLGRIKSPVIAGFLLSKIARSADSGHRLHLSEASFLPDSGSEQQINVLITVLGNLIENALDALHGQPEGEIHLLLHYQSGRLTCEVSDDGPGIDPAHLEHIFSKGFSTKGEDRGVGLFLLQQQLDTLGGSISVESEPGVLTQFLVQLPWDEGY